MTSKKQLNDRVWSGVLPPKLHKLAKREAKRKGISHSDLIRLAIATFLGDDTLAESRRGRPPLKPTA